MSKNMFNTNLTLLYGEAKARERGLCNILNLRVQSLAQHKKP